MNLNSSETTMELVKKQNKKKLKLKTPFTALQLLVAIKERDKVVNAQASSLFSVVSWKVYLGLHH